MSTGIWEAERTMGRQAKKAQLNTWKAEAQLNVHVKRNTGKDTHGAVIVVFY
jgi:hypothetical protein